MKKRIFSLLLMLCVLVASLSATVSAEADSLGDSEKLTEFDKAVIGLSGEKNICCEQASFRVVPPEGYRYEFNLDTRALDEFGEGKTVECTTKEDGTTICTIMQDSERSVGEFGIIFWFYGDAAAPRMVSCWVQIIDHVDDDSDHHCDYCKARISYHDYAQEETLADGTVCKSCSVCGKRFTYENKADGSLLNSGTIIIDNGDFADGTIVTNLVAKTVSKTVHTDLIINMEQETVVPGSVFETVADKDVTMYINTEQALWQIDTSTYTKESFRDVDFDVKTGENTTSIPDELITEVSYGDPDRTLECSIADHGDLGFDATMYLGVDNQYQDNRYQIYYYNHSDMELIGSGRVVDNKKLCSTIPRLKEQDNNMDLVFDLGSDLEFDEKFDEKLTVEAGTDSWAVLTLSHFSDYMIVFSDDTSEDQTETVDDGTIQSESKTSPKTREGNDMMLWIALLFVSGGVLTGTAVCGKKKS